VQTVEKKINVKLSHITNTRCAIIYIIQIKMSCRMLH